jgi:hypothetical protein
MSIKNVGNTTPVVGIKHEDPKPKIGPKPLQIDNSQQGKDSKVGENNFVASAMKSKLNNAVTNAAKVDPNQKADEILKANGDGKSEKNANNVGKQIAEIAKTDPELAVKVMNKVQEKLKDTDKGDNVASGFVQNLNDAELRKVADTNEGKSTLRDLQNRLLSTDGVHKNERAEATRIDVALNPNVNMQDVKAAADRIEKAAGNGTQSAQALIDELGKGNPAFQNALMGELARRDEGNLLKGIIAGAGGEQGKQYPALSESGQKTIANALASAYKNGFLPTDNKGNNYLDTLTLGVGREWNQYVGNLISKADNSASTQLKTDYANKALAEATNKNSYDNPADAVSAALRAISTDPTAMAAVLDKYKDTKVNGLGLTDLLKLAAQSPTARVGVSDALPDVIEGFMTGAAKLPSSKNDLTLSIFRSATKDMIGSFDGEFNKGRADALGKFFIANANLLTNTMNDVNASPQDMKAFSRFVELTMFNKDSSVSEDVKKALSFEASKLRDAALKYDSSKNTAENDAAKAAARTLGTLSGNVFNGYFLRVGDIKAENEANKAFVKNLVGFAVDFIPLGKLVENTAVKGLMKGILDEGVALTKDQLKDYLTDKLTSDKNADPIETINQFVQGVLVNLPDNEAKQEAIQNQRIALGLFGVLKELGG